MKIDRWPIDEIMQLPDWCFGRRWWIGCQCYAGDGKSSCGWAEEPFPDRFVLWAVMVGVYSPGMTDGMRVSMRVSAQKFTTTEEVMAADRLLKGVGRIGDFMDLYVASNQLTSFGGIRQYCHHPNKRFACQANGDQVNMYYCDVNILISSIPKEVPDWLFSGLAGVRS